MPRVHFVKKARKDNKAYGIKKGDSYYWWKNRMPGRAAGVKRISKTPPKQSQTCGNPFYSAIYAIQESIGDAKPKSLADLQSERDSWVEEINNLKEETDEKLQNMPDGLRDGDTGQLLQERVDALEQWASDLESVEIPDEPDPDSDQSEQDLIDEALAGCSDTDPGI